MTKYVKSDHDGEANLAIETSVLASVYRSEGNSSGCTNSASEKSQQRGQVDQG